MYIKGTVLYMHIQNIYSYIKGTEQYKNFYVAHTKLNVVVVPIE